jgi:hypothetical protein
MIAYVVYNIYIKNLTAVPLIFMHLSGNIDRTDNSKNRIIKRHEWGIIFHDTL